MNTTHPPDLPNSTLPDPKSSTPHGPRNSSHPGRRSSSLHGLRSSTRRLTTRSTRACRGCHPTCDPPTPSGRSLRSPVCSRVQTMPLSWPSAVPAAQEATTRAEGRGGSGCWIRCSGGSAGRAAGPRRWRRRRWMPRRRGEGDRQTRCPQERGVWACLRSSGGVGLGPAVPLSPGKGPKVR